MLQFDADQLKNILMNEEGFSEFEANTTIAQMRKLHDRLQDCFNQWLHDRTVSDDFSVAGVTLKLIMEIRKCSFCTALIFMDHYIDSPEQAKNFLKRPIFRRDPTKFKR